MKAKYYFYFIVIILSMTTGLLGYIIYPNLESISSLWETNLQPLFIITYSLVVYVISRFKYWKLPAILLFSIVAFSIEKYLLIHNILSIAFFLSCLYPIFRKRLDILNGCLLLLMIPFYFYNIPIVVIEIYGINVLALHHSKMLLKRLRI